MMRPGQVTPMLLTSASEIPSGEYIFQRKWDGVRMLSFVARGRVTLQNRRLNLRTEHYPELAVLADALSATAAILDGEVVVLREGGRTSFPAILRREGATNPQAARRLRESLPVHYMVFDMLELDGCSITHLPLEVRSAMLSERLAQHVGIVHIVESCTDGPALYEDTKLTGAEGIVAKAKGSRYFIGQRTFAWQKIKHKLREEFIVVGYTLRAGQVNSLLVATEAEGGGYNLCGRVGSGLTNEHIKLLTQELPRLSLPCAPEGFPRGTTAVQPVLLADVEFMEWTETLKIRAPVIKGFAPRIKAYGR